MLVRVYDRLLRLRPDPARCRHSPSGPSLRRMRNEGRRVGRACSGHLCSCTRLGDRSSTCRCCHRDGAMDELSLQHIFWLVKLAAHGVHGSTGRSVSNCMRRLRCYASWLHRPGLLNLFISVYNSFSPRLHENERVKASVNKQVEMERWSSEQDFSLVLPSSLPPSSLPLALPLPLPLPLAWFPGPDAAGAWAKQVFVGEPARTITWPLSTTLFRYTKYVCC